MFYGEKLEQLRKLHDLSRKDLAQKVGVSEQAIGQYENDQATPRVEILNKLIQIFNINVSFFASPSFVESGSINSDTIAYRSKGRNAIKKIRNEVTYVEFAKYFVDYFESFVKSNIGGFELLKEKIDSLSEQNSKLKIEASAQIAREFYALNNNRSLMAKLEQSGITILEKNLNEKIDAYSGYAKDGQPYIVLGNINKTAVRRNFDLAHELGHLLLHSHKIMTELSDREHTLIEQEANDFAAAFLLPKSEFINDFLHIKRKTNPDSYLELKKKYLVSIGTLEYRAYKLKMITYQGNRYFWAQMTKKGYRNFEPLDDQLVPVKPGKVKSLLTFILDNNLISLNSLVEQFNIKPKFLIDLFDLKFDFFDKYKIKPSTNVSLNIINLNEMRGRLV